MRLANRKDGMAACTQECKEYPTYTTPYNSTPKETHARACTQSHTCVRACVQTHKHARMSTHTYTQACTHIHTHDTHMHTLTHTLTCMHAHTPTQTPSDAGHIPPQLPSTAKQHISQLAEYLEVGFMGQARQSILCIA